MENIILDGRDHFVSCHRRGSFAGAVVWLLTSMGPGDTRHVEGFRGADGSLQEVSDARVRVEVSRAAKKVGGAFFTRSVGGLSVVVCAVKADKSAAVLEEAPLKVPDPEVPVELAPLAALNSEKPGVLVCTRHQHELFPANSLAGALASLFDGAPVGSFLHLVGYDIGPNERPGMQHKTDWTQRVRTAVSQVHGKGLSCLETRRLGGVLTIYKHWVGDLEL